MRIMECPDLTIVKQEVDFNSVDPSIVKTEENGVSNHSEASSTVDGKISIDADFGVERDNIKEEIIEVPFVHYEENNSECVQPESFDCSEENIIKVEASDAITSEVREKSDVIGGCVCSVCGRGFSSAHDLNEHMRVHDGQKLFPCEECGKTFLLPVQLAHHMKTHSGGNVVASKAPKLEVRLREHLLLKYTCEQCGKAFKNSTRLREHRMFHSGAKPLVCEVCGRNFLWSADLSTHSLTHIAGKKCPTCGVRFRNLKTHLRTHSKVNLF